MRFNALMVVVAVFAAGLVCTSASVQQGLGTGLDDSWQMALFHVHVAIAPLLFLPFRGGRARCLDNLLAGTACWAAGLASVMVFSFASMVERTWQFVGLSAAAWLACTGLLSLAARLDRPWIGSARVVALCALGLPPLWHYLSLEYGGASSRHLKPLSPGWSMATQDVNLWPLLIAGAALWAAAFAIPERRQREPAV